MKGTTEAPVRPEIPTLRTERLVLRPTALSDARDYHALLSDPAVAAGLQRQVPASFADSERQLHRVLARQSTGEATSWSAVVGESGEGPAIGFLGLVRTDFVHRSSEVFYELRSAHWNQGFVTEALRRVIRHAFEPLALHRLEGRAHPANQRSVQVLERCGFKREGVLRESYFLEGKFYDSVVYGLIAPGPSL